MRKYSKLRAVSVLNNQSRYFIQTKKIQSLADTVLQLLGKNQRLEVAVVSDSQIRIVNRLFHGTNSATDVLAFEPPKSGKFLKSENKCLGEIIVSIDRAAFFSKQFQISLDEELIRYIIHGVLHLVGERDNTKPKKDRMIRRQESILNQLRPLPKIVVR